MYNIKYLLVNDAGSKSRACNSRHRFIPHIGHCIELDCGNRPELIDQLVKLREHWPNAKILGVSELDIASSHAPVRVNPWMNELRSELSEQREQRERTQTLSSRDESLQSKLSDLP